MPLPDSACWLARKCVLKRRVRRLPQRRLVRRWYEVKKKLLQRWLVWQCGMKRKLLWGWLVRWHGPERRSLR